ncbi:uncharacterized protein LOC113756573 [Coffea eugenioides]|uniref:uncharacterized protein LOC113756573 n=1 Tax=Coffea eugenioides TaxID=49369 RepID=UPI000F610D61|nr:uncharacterized protein LOC113756573 [Coffea eugenioides]
MAPPRNVREVQQLTGRMAALSRFLSRSAVRGLPFFRILKIPKDFQWTEECQKAFADLKVYVAELPTLNAPEQGENLFLYLSACNEAVSAILVREDRGAQKPIYYVSRTLQRPETRYTPAEKLVLALVHAACKFRPYFQTHSIVVITDQPLRQILTKPEVSGRMTKWVVELAEHDIGYQPRTAIKAQVLADFLAEGASLTLTEPSPLREDIRPEEPWVLFVDGASNKEGSGVGLRIAHQMGKIAIKVWSDSQLIVHQVRGEYETKEDVMKKYLAKLDELHGVLWAYRTTPRTATHETPFSLTYGVEVVVPAEIGLSSPRTQNFVASSNEEELRCSLDMLEAKREEAAIRMAKYKSQLAHYHNAKVRNIQYQPGDLVLRKNSVSKAHNSNKLDPNWEGPYKVLEASRVGYCKLAKMDGSKVPRTWHFSNLRLFVG